MVVVPGLWFLCGPTGSSPAVSRGSEANVIPGAGLIVQSGSRSGALWTPPRFLSVH